MIRRLKKWICVVCLSFIVSASYVVGSLLIFTDNTSALRHENKAIPLFSNIYYTGSWSGDTGSSYGLGNPYLSISYFTSSSLNVNLSQISSMSVKSPRHFYTYYDSSNNQCKYNSSSSAAEFYGYSDHSYYIDTTGTSNNLYIGFQSYFEYTPSSSAYPKHYSSAVCLQPRPFGSRLSGSSLPHPQWDDSSLVNIPLASRPLYIDLPPYYYSYDSYYNQDSHIDTSSGIHYSSSLKMSDIFGLAPNKFRRLVIPLGQARSDAVGSVTSGRSIEYNGVFDFSGEGNTFSWSPLFSDYGYFKLKYAGLPISGQNVVGSVDCTANLRSLEANGLLQLEFSCPFVASVDFRDDSLYFWLDIGIDSPSNLTADQAQNMYVFNTNSNWKFATSYFITDYDSTPGSDWNSTPTGNHLSEAPGNAEGEASDSSSDWFASLSHLFNFSLFNPFAPIFALFQDNSGCYNIPTIAGMLHSETTLYCPWFPSSVRSVLTPVFSLASVMLLFGFIVRWLGSSSGNFFEDSASEEVSNQGGRWGHFKRGGK